MSFLDKFLLKYLNGAIFVDIMKYVFCRGGESVCTIMKWDVNITKKMAPVPRLSIVVALAVVQALLLHVSEECSAILLRRRTDDWPRYDRSVASHPSASGRRRRTEQKPVAGSSSEQSGSAQESGGKRK